VGGGAAAGVVLLHDRGDDGGRSDDKSATTASPTAPTPPSSAPPAAQDSQESADASAQEPSASAPDGGEPTGPQDVPDGYHRVVDEKGFSFVVPEAWYRQGVKNGSQITYAGGTGLEGYLVGVIPDAGYTSYANTLKMEQHLEDEGTKKDYRRVELARNTFHGRDGARWEYTYEDAAGTTIHCVDQSYVAADGTEYAILLTARDTEWDSAQEMYRIALDSWRLTDTD
ncbi:hypothetical protein GTW43_11095, partial [Streptomyces sp. SID5785]|nr:hypothetical protein [Streptomyces sp. SID5785]